MIATSWPQLALLAPEPASVPQTAPEQTAAAPQTTPSPELQQLKEDLAQLKQELQQLKEIPAALASLRQSMDRLAGSQQQIAGTIAKLGTQKPASPPRPAPAPGPKPLTPPQSEVRWRRNRVTRARAVGFSLRAQRGTGRPLAALGTPPIWHCL
jgi:small-conductance mechanosensitive channel